MTKRFSSKVAVATALSAALALGACGGSTSGGAYEPGDITYLVGFPAGGGTDLTARKAGDLAERLKIVDGQITVENLDGGAGARALSDLARRGDDDTITQIVDLPTTLYAGGPVGPDDIIPIGELASNALVLVTPADSTAEDLEQTMQALVDDQGVVGVAGTLDQREPSAWLDILSELGIDGDVNLVPSAGASDMLPELLSGRMSAAMLVPTLVADYVKSGKLKAVAVTTADRIEALPDVPTLSELGADVVYERPQGIAMSVKASDGAVAYWKDAVAELVASDEWAQFKEQQGYLPETRTADEYATWLEDQGAAYEEYVDELK